MDLMLVVSPVNALDKWMPLILAGNAQPSVA